LAKLADAAGLGSLWIGETCYRDGFMHLATLAEYTDDIKLGTGVVNVFSRSPALIAMSLATLETLSDARS
jgi:alkanesulfonate monooxygenase SsuD/methylene tetrahydromethanopterin reductase-like flavin-dependent oxidoreductase (luciferase family)